MPSTTLYKKWDLVLVSFPFTDFTADKRRPALVISPDSYNVGQDITIAFVTSQSSAQRKVGDYEIEHWRQAGLVKASIVRMKFATIDKSIVVKTLGELAVGDRLKLEKCLLAFFGS